MGPSSSISSAKAALGRVCRLRARRRDRRASEWGDFRHKFRRAGAAAEPGGDCWSRRATSQSADNVRDRRRAARDSRRDRRNSGPPGWTDRARSLRRRRDRRRPLRLGRECGGGAGGRRRHALARRAHLGARRLRPFVGADPVGAGALGLILEASNTSNRSCQPSGAIQRSQSRALRAGGFIPRSAPRRDCNRFGTGAKPWVIGSTMAMHPRLGNPAAVDVERRRRACWRRPRSTGRARSRAS